MPKPKNIDWNHDGAADSGDGWIELYNAGSGDVDLSGWRLSLRSTARSATFTLPQGSSIGGRGYLVFFNLETRLNPDNAGGELRLLYPSGNQADAMSWASLREDESTARSRDGSGSWTTDCVPSLDATNCQNNATVTGSFNLPFFRRHIANPSHLTSVDLGVLATNILLALILALAMGIFGTLLNDAIESHEERLLRLFAPVRAVVWRVRRITDRVGQDATQSRVLSWLSFAAGLVVILVIYGVVLAFLDPQFNLADRDGWLLILALAVSAGLVSLSDDIALYFYLRRRGTRAVIRVHGGNMILVVLTTLSSRFSGLTPGLLIGSPAGIEDVDDAESEVQSHLLGIGAIAVIAILAGLLSMVLNADAWTETLLLLIFATGVQTLFFEMLPLKYLHGRGVFQFNRSLWLVIFTLTTVVFLGTMLNPDGAFVSAFQSSNMTILALFVVAFCVLSAGLWFYLQNLEKAETAGSAK